MSAVSPLKKNEMLLLLTYMGRHTFRIKVAEVSSEENAVWMIASFLFVIENKIYILQVTHTVSQNCPRQSVAASGT